jgi:lichenan operon transcriptional antiterminator
MRNERQEQLLAILSERRDWITSRRLAVLLQVSDRTIRSDVALSPLVQASPVRKASAIIQMSG